uniref:Uncharacterized protein n=1 Tax=Panagrolaimus sp. JU765 TaxID=591449 RepID=A0AC34QUK1_9BILA
MSAPSTNNNNSVNPEVVTDQKESVETGKNEPISSTKVQNPKNCASASRAPSRTPSRASQRSVTFSLHTPNRHEPTYEESSQFNPAQLDTVSISARRNSQSRASQAHSTNVPRSMVLYDQQPQSMIPGGYVAPYDAVPVPAPVPMWTYPIPPPPPPQLFAYFPPSPLDAKTMRKIMKKAAEDEKRYQTKYQPSSCSKFCCGGAAPLFWILLILILLFFIAVLIVALIYV